MFQATDLNIWLGKLVSEHGRIRLNKPVSEDLNRVSILHTWNTVSPRKEIPGEVHMLICICKAENKTESLKFTLKRNAHLLLSVHRCLLLSATIDFLLLPLSLQTPPPDRNERPTGRQGNLVYWGQSASHVQPTKKNWEQTPCDSKTTRKL